MAVPLETTTVTIGGTSSSSPSTLNNHEANHIVSNGNEDSEKAIQPMNDDQYPHGLKLVLLAGASVVAVFLIALDQVSAHVPAAMIDNKLTLEFRLL